MIFKLFRSSSNKIEQNEETESSFSPKIENTLKETNSTLNDTNFRDEKLLKWLHARMESPEVSEANNVVSDLTLQFNAGGTLFYLSKSGVGTFKITRGRCSNPDVLIRISPEVESKLASVNDFTEFFQEYRKYANLSGGDEYIRIKYLSDLSQLSKKGILRSKLLRTLLMT